MRFGKKDHLFGLDIGSAAIKAAEVAATKKGYVLKRFGTVDIPPNVIDEGSIQDPETIVDALKSMLREHGFRQKKAAISVGGYSVIVKKVNMQMMTEQELQDSIQFEAEQYIPFDISDVNLDFQILGESESNPNQMSVLLVAAKKDMLDEYLDVIRTAGLLPAIIDVDAFALQNIYDVNYEPSDDANVALIDIGAVKTSLNILKGNNSLFMRDVTLGCRQIPERIAEQAGCMIDEAETLFRGAPSDAISPDEIHQIQSSVLVGWTSEIARALEFFYSTYSDERVDRIVLSGGGANILDFHKQLAEETGTMVETIDPFKRIDTSDSSIDTGQLERVAPQTAISLGLAIRRVDDK